jgi:hypothetical protein
MVPPMDLHLIGGCGSSGTTLLARLLDGCGPVRSGPELGVFHHRRLFTAGPAFRETVYGLLSGREDAGLGMMVGRLKLPLVPAVFFQYRDFYGVRDAASELAFLDRATSLPAMVAALHAGMARTLGTTERLVLVDQTPKNCVSADVFLDTVPGGRFIHLVRDGRDVVCSLTRRWASEAPGHDAATYVQAALTRWVWDVTQARRAADRPGYLEVRYEELVTAPLDTLNRILGFLDQPAVGREALEPTRSPSLLLAGTQFHGGPKPTWSASVQQPVSARGVGRWRSVLTGHVADQLHAFVVQPPGGAPIPAGPLLTRYAWD